ncbi:MULTISPECIES: hypothetical protein [Pseudomonas]|uniref:hypothetical protein n=1 Tax=Pseudomonas TaxID=286 RepID=UPI002579AA7C|nr:MULTISPECIES: hypothetical protein [Pseudomonas]
MRRYDSITSNLPLCTPLGLQVTLWQLGQADVVFKIQRADLVFFLRSDRPDIFGFPSNANSLRLLFMTAVDSQDRRSSDEPDLSYVPIANLL